MYVQVPPGVRARDMFCDIEQRHVRFGLRGNPPFLDVSARGVPGGVKGKEGCRVRAAAPACEHAAAVAAV